MIRKIITHSNFWPLLIVIFFGVLAGRSLIFQSGYFNMHDDLQMMRQLEMEKCFLDGQIPCRWVPDMGYGFGFPLFNFYPPLPYLFGELFRLLGLSFITAVKLTFAFSFIASGVTMYLLAKEFWGRLGGAVSAIFYIWAPYHSVDVYVRGAMNEAWALIWFPAILLASYKIVTSSKRQVTRWVLTLALSWTGLLLSHNLMVIIFTPVFAGWCLLWVWRLRLKNLAFVIGHLALSGFLALGLSAFFTLPAILEQKYVQVNTLVSGYYEYIAHFVSLNQLLVSRFWGFGPSIWGTSDGMPFQVGHVHWILSLITFFLFIYKFIKTKKINNLLLVTCYLLAVGWFAAFMTHARSILVWQALPFLNIVQFPWRFLALVIFSHSFIAGSLVVLTRPLGKLRTTIVSFLLILLVVYNWNYFKPLGGKLGPLTDEEKFQNPAWELQQTAGIYDYLPKTAWTAPKKPRLSIAEFMEGSGVIEDVQEGTNWAKFRVNINENESVLRVNIFQFPEWKIFIDGNEVESFVPKNEEWGRMWVNVPNGKHDVSIKFFNTPLRSFSNIISLATWVGLISFPLWRKRFLS